MANIDRFLVTLPQSYMYILESELLGLEPQRVVPINNLLSYQMDVSTLLYIINNNYKDGKKGNGIWYSLITINISNMNNHFGSKEKKNLPIVLNINLKDQNNELKSLGLV